MKEGKAWKVKEGKEFEGKEIGRECEKEMGREKGQAREGKKTLTSFAK